MTTTDTKNKQNFSPASSISSDIIADYGYISTLNSDYGYISTLDSDVISTNFLQANEFYTGSLDAHDGYIDNLTSNYIYTPTLQSNDIYTTQLNANNANIDDLNTDTLSTNTLEVSHLYGNNLNSNDGYIAILSSDHIDAGYGSIRNFSSDAINTNTLQTNELYTNSMGANYAAIDQLNTQNLNAQHIATESISFNPWSNTTIDLGSHATAEGYTSASDPPQAVDHYRDENGHDFYVVRDTQEVYKQLSNGLQRSSVDVKALTWVQSGEMSTYVNGGREEYIERKVTQQAVSYAEQQQSYMQTQAAFNFSGSSHMSVILDDTSHSSTSNELVSGVIRPYSTNADEKYGVRATSTQDVQVISETILTSQGLSTTGQLRAQSIVLDGQDLKTTIQQGDQNTLVAANTYTQTQVTQVSAQSLQAAKAEDVKVLASANQYTDVQMGMLNSNVSRLN